MKYVSQLPAFIGRWKLLSQAMMNFQEMESYRL